MRHFATASFWRCYDSLPSEIQRLADAKFGLLKDDPRHPSLHFKKIGVLWSVRIGRGYRALATEEIDGYSWFWVGTHTEYDEMLK